MQDFLGILFVFYLILAAVFFPLLLGHMVIKARDCRLIHSEPCFWVIVPQSEAGQ